VLVCENDVSCLNELAAESLESSERLYFSTLRYERRQMSYLLGRYAAKLALTQAFSEPHLRNIEKQLGRLLFFLLIEIARGVFEQPVVQCSRCDRTSFPSSREREESRTRAKRLPGG
jgi:phosphopantetheinyl transferase (holo-ACP synthase)